MSALQAFEAAARFENFSRAAEELSLTHSAICRQIAQLESQLGVVLFDRTKRGVRLNQAGQHYAREVSSWLEQIAQGSTALLQTERHVQPLELAVFPTLATRWLLPRLPQFAAVNPDIELHLHTCTRPFLFEGSPIQAAIYAGNGLWPGAHSQRLMAERLCVVCAPSLVAPKQRLSVADCQELPLLHAGTRLDAWNDWFRRRGIDHPGAKLGSRFEQFSMLIEAAVLGMGVALIPDVLVQQELNDGRLLAPCGSPDPSDRAYYLVWPEATALPSAVQQLRDWLVEQCRSAP